MMLKPAGGFLGFSASFVGQKDGKCHGSGVKWPVEGR